jgi:hypothetical protein
VEECFGYFVFDAQQLLDGLIEITFVPILGFLVVYGYDVCGVADLTFEDGLP